TVLAALALQEVDAAAELLAGRGRKPGPRKPTPRDVSRAIERVAERLGNTPAVCRKCYVHPDVIASYLDGTLSASLGRRVDVPLASRRPGALRPDEAAVLALLQRRMAEDKRGDRLETQLRRSLRSVRQRRQRG